MAYYCVMAMRTSFDLASGYTIGKNMQTLDERSVLIRCIFLETVAGELQIFVEMKNNPKWLKKVSLFFQQQMALVLRSFQL